MLSTIDLVLWDAELSIRDREDVGFELALLGEISDKVHVLPQIVITPQALKVFLKDNNLDTQIKHLLGTLNPNRHDSLTQISSYIRRLITKSPIHKDIYEDLYKKYEKLKTKKVLLKADFFKDKKFLSSEKWEVEGGDAVLAEKIREAWAHLYSEESLKKHSIHHENHHTFNCVLSVTPITEFSLTGHVKTLGRDKNEFEIEAHSMVRFSYNKREKKLMSGEVLSSGSKEALSAHDIKTLINYAHVVEKEAYLPHVISWGKHEGTFWVTGVKPTSETIEYKDTYNSLVESVTVHPGITIGRLRVVDERTHTEIVMNDEIVVLRKIDRNMLLTLKKAKGIILEEEPDPEITDLLKSFGIPTVVRKKGRLLYSTGDVVSLNATTGEIKRGNMLVS